MGGDGAAVLALCEEAAQGEVLAPANFNAPGQVVIAGAKSAIERAVLLSKSRSLKAIPLKVSAPFHSTLMAPARQRVQTALAKVKVSDPRVPVVVNVLAEPVQSGARLAELLVAQVDHAAPQGHVNILGTNNHMRCNAILGRVTDKATIETVENFGQIDPMIAGCKLT